MLLKYVVLCSIAFSHRLKDPGKRPESFEIPKTNLKESKSMKFDKSQKLFGFCIYDVNSIQRRN